MKSPVDLARLNDITEGDPESLRHMVHLYQRTSRDHLKQLAAAVAANDDEAVGRIAHNVAGSSAMIGIVLIVEPLRQLEEMAHRRDLSRATDLYKQIQERYHQVCRFFDQLPAFQSLSHSAQHRK